MSLVAGTRLGPYEIVSPLGAGGMGEVYRARDAKLGREVAIKILPDHFANDAERLARFEREARTLAALNHPHIAQIYGFEQSGTTSALVMELVEGEDLSQRIARGAIPLDEALPIAKQIADALEAAHEQGIIHRDLKPANIKVRDDGTVKVLDFGLAKAVEAGAAASPSGATITSPAMSMPGVILGTAAYMAPEQAKGKPVDKRADIWAFGCVLYEMLAGRRAFAGEDVSETIASILKTEPDWSPIPAPARPLLVQCLQKDARRRLRDIGDAFLLIGSSPSPSVAPALTRARVPWTVAALALAVAAIVSLLHFGEVVQTLPPFTFEVMPPDQNVFTDAYLALSPDGRRLLFTARDRDGIVRIWMRDLTTSTTEPLPGSEGARSPFWSPDGRFVAFAAERKLQRIELSNRQLITLCQVPTNVGIGTWNSDGTIVFGSRLAGPLYRVADTGGAAEAISALDPSRGETYHALPVFLADGRRFLYLRSSLQGPQHTGIYLGSIEVAPERQSTTRLFETNLGVSYVPSPPGPGFVFSMNGGNLLAHSFDERSATTLGSPVRIAERIASAGALGLYSVSPAGVLAYRTGQAGGPTVMDLFWHDREGKPQGAIGEPGAYTGVALSPNGSHVAVARAQEGGLQPPDLWTIDLARGINSRITSDPNSDAAPLWSPDGQRLVFRSNRSGRFDLYERNANGIGGDRLLYQSAADKTPSSWSRDGRVIVFDSATPGRKSDLYALAVADRTVTRITDSEFNEAQAQLSPDGRWVAFVSDESGRQEVYVRTYATASAANVDALRQWRVSRNGGVRPRWRRDGRELFFRSGTSVVSVPITVSGAALTLGAPQQLFDARTPYVNIFDVTSDGQKFLIAMAGDASVVTPITVLLNWRGALDNSMSDAKRR